MGGAPLTALNVVAFPLERLGGDVLRAILRGGPTSSTRPARPSWAATRSTIPSPSTASRSPAPSTRDADLTNAGARPGDALVLTKPLGVGAISTARKRGAAADALLAAAVDVMTQLNAAAAAAARAAGAHALTDVTGFGLLGHLHSLGPRERRRGGDRRRGSAGHRRASSSCSTRRGRRLGRQPPQPRVCRRASPTFAAGVSAWRARWSATPRRRAACSSAVRPTRRRGAAGAVVGRLVDGPPGAISVG